MKNQRTVATVIITASALLTALRSFRLPDIVDSAGWQALRSSAVITFPMPY